MPEYQALTFEYPKYPYLPYYTTDMPYEVMLGYIVMDSVCNYGNALLLDDFISRQTFNDTIKKIMNYIYRMADWDPFLFIETQYESNFYMHPSNVIEKLINKSASLSTNFNLIKLLLKSHYILHIRVTDTLTRRYQSSNITIPVAIVNYEILDTIKGRKIPICKDISLNYGSESVKAKKAPSGPNNCSQFGYSLLWQRSTENNDIVIINPSGGGTSLFDENGVLWTKTNSEYIVCLNISLLCGTAGFEYVSIRPNVIPSLTCTMYPIENGKVQDPGNEFGFGTSSDIDEFKLLLRQKINEILSY